MSSLHSPSQVDRRRTSAAGSRRSRRAGRIVGRGARAVLEAEHSSCAPCAVARERALQQGEMTVATGSADLAQRELQRAKELHEQNFVSQNYLDKQRAEAQVAGGRTDQASERRRLSQREVELAAAQLAQRSISAPIAGVVVERFMSPGEFVDQKPILRIAAIDPLRVDVLVPAVAFGQVEVGMKGAVMPELLNKKEHIAVVKMVGRVIHAGTTTFRVRLIEGVEFAQAFLRAGDVKETSAGAPACQQR